nr:restriction endonuclease [Arthrobacter pigmenti]
MTPVLRALEDGRSRSRAEVTSGAMELANVSDEQRAVRDSSGGLKAKGRVGWAISHLIATEAIIRPKPALYTITDTGHELLLGFPDGLAQRDLRTVPAYRAHQQALNDARQKSASSVVSEEAEEEGSPTDLIDQAIEQMEAEVGVALLTRLRESSPEFFEEAVVDLLLKMGYGGAEQRGRRIGGSGDGGVDGVIDQDALGLDQVYIQAKRYKDGNNVGRETIQAFVGALQGTGASRGVFITTSSFTDNARKYAAGIASRVILIDSVRLVNLMIEYRVGVQVKQTYDVVDLDEDYFE